MTFTLTPSRKKNNKPGGKDSNTITHRLKFEFWANPLRVTFSPMMLCDLVLAREIYGRQEPEFRHINRHCREKAGR